MLQEVNLRLFRKGLTISPKRFTSVTILVSTTLAWFFVTVIFFEDILLSQTSDISLVYLGEVLFFGSSAFFAVLGSWIDEKISRRKLLITWVGLGIFASAAPAIFVGANLPEFVSILLGLSLGLGFPCCLAYLADCTVVEERARISGTIVFVTFILAFLIFAASSLFSFGIMETVLVLVLLRAISLFALPLDYCNKKDQKNSSWMSVLTNKEFAFYIVPWILFNVAGGLSWWLIPQTPEFQQAVSTGTILRYATAAIFGLVSGVVADRIGRKKPIVVGLISLGVGFAFLGLATSSLSIIVYLTISGFAWGSFLAIYLAVPGDLAFSGAKGKFYAIGAFAPLIIYMSLDATPELSGINIPAGLLSGALSAMIFLSVVPVLRASETLPQALIRERKLKEHIKKVTELVQKSEKTKGR